MAWVIEFEEPYDDWDVTTDIDADASKRVAVLECMDNWRQHGPPDEAEFDANRQTYSTPIPGSPVMVEYIEAPYTDPPSVIVRRFYE